MALNDFVVNTPRPLPVILLCDTSGSMSVDGKIEALNEAVRQMINTFAQESRIRAEIQVGLITGLTHQCLYFEQPHTFEQILFIQTAEPALVGHA